MSDLKHTPEPWRVDINTSLKVRIIKSSSGCAVGKNDIAQIMTCNPRPVPEEIQYANAHRIVDCVNACVGMPNPKIYIDAMRDEVSAVKKSFELADAKAKKYIKQDKEIRSLIKADPNESTYDEVERLKNQRDTLLAALERWQEEWVVGGDSAQKANNYSIEQQIKAAIAKAKGGTNG